MVLVDEDDDPSGSGAEGDGFDELVGPALAKALREKGFTTLTPVQDAVLAADLAGRDLRISSQTGSGKTVAIGFTFREDLEAGEGTRAIVVTPTRELAKQVCAELSWLFAPLRAQVASVTGGGSYRDELRALKASPAVVVGTPGRLLDHLDRGTIDPSQASTIVFDEADRMLDLGFREDLERILSFAPDPHRTHLVSATFPREVTALADRVQVDPVRIEGTPLGSANQDIEHLVHLVQHEERFAAIVNLLLATPDAPTLVFARTRADVAELTKMLSDDGFTVDSLSGEMEQRERNRALAAFKRGALQALVATDVAARGIDVPDVVRVIHAEPPGDPESYTHRSGRTGRAGRKGTSSILLTPPALNRVSFLLKRAGVRWRFEPVPSAASIAAARDQRLFEELTREEETTDAPAAEMALAARIAATGSSTRAIARLLARVGAGAPSPRAVRPIAPPADKRAKRAEPQERQERPERPHVRGAPPDRPQEGGWVPFRISWGQVHGADARRLVAMLCRRGGIRGSDIGAIRVARTHSVVEVAQPVASAFEKATSVPDPRDPRVRIRPELPHPPHPAHSSPKEGRAPARKDHGHAPPKRKHKRQH